MGDPVAEPADDHVRVLHERQRGVSFWPAPGVFQRLREIPVIQRDERLDSDGEQPVDEVIVEVKPSDVAAPQMNPVGNDADLSCCEVGPVIALTCEVATVRPVPLIDWFSTDKLPCQRHCRWQLLTSARS